MKVFRWFEDGLIRMFVIQRPWWYRLPRWFRKWWATHVRDAECLRCGKRICDAEWVANWGECDGCFGPGPV